jgi:serine acetyltransferase
LIACSITIAACLIRFALTGAQISRRATIGKGLTVLHPAGTVVGATTVIGEGCTLVQGNTIGQPPLACAFPGDLCFGVILLIRA